MKPMMYAMPVIKTATDRAALRKAATSGDAASSSAPIRRRIRCAQSSPSTASPGIFNAPVALETYAKVFEEEGALDKLEAFASLNGPKHYGCRRTRIPSRWKNRPGPGRSRSP